MLARNYFFGKVMRRVSSLCQNGASGCRIDYKTSKSQVNSFHAKEQQAEENGDKVKGTDQKDNLNSGICGC